ncbi:MAG: Spy/CpxP family protein refolding chaperone [Devosia sp.]|uniref:Spy/CpxP family protein refolding chaperone n=1 Tax=Devosia sp. TaxID=1871048 RepID=UPI001A0835A6|nr:Spy/CpxP family protein refolding chaperone [Devosia sp.]MBF0679747.1 Spy/CpxP family protein refolding chaperone [Devosia sp.]
MKTISTKIILAMMTATLGLGAIAPVMAQTTAPSAETRSVETAQEGQKSFRPGHDGPRRGGGMSSLLNFERGAEAIDIAVVRLTHRLDLSAEQQTLLDTLKSDALAASETLASATEGLRPTPPAKGDAPSAPDFSRSLENRIAFDTARLDALKSIQPAATAFFDSLTDAQKAELMPDRGTRGDRGGPRQHGPNRG